MNIVASNEMGRVPVTIFRITGELGAESSDLLRQEARSAVERGAQHLLLDLSEVTYVSSSGLQAIHDIFSQLRSASEEEDSAVHKGIASGTYRSEHLKLLSPSRHVLRTLKMAGFDMFLELHTDLQQAILSF
jgi:ABC-type transporter Mla MlaB component